MKYTTKGHTKRVSLRSMRIINSKNESAKLHNKLLDHLLKFDELMYLPFGDETDTNIIKILEDMGKLIKKMIPLRRSTRIKKLKEL
jgi:hypothetical protein